MNFTKSKRLLALGGWFLILALIYWGFGNTPWTMPITYVYFGLCLVLSVAYVLVNGGITPILEEDRRREAATRKKYLADKGKLHPIKRKDKFRRFQVKAEREEVVEIKPKSEPTPRPNPLRLAPEVQRLVSQILLVLVIPLYLIFMIDWILLALILKG